METHRSDSFRRAPGARADEVWRTLFARQRPQLAGRVHSRIRAGLECLPFDPAHLPRHRALSARLHDLCGWRIETVPGLIPVADFFALLRERRFPAPEWIRHPDELDYTPAPDAFHDLFGHLPQLVDKGVSAWIECLAAAARGKTREELVGLERLYWFTVEFGLVRERGHLRAWGGRARLLRE